MTSLGAKINRLCFPLCCRTCRAPCNDQVRARFTNFRPKKNKIYYLQIYNSRIAFASYPNRALFSKRPEVCPLVIKLVKICSGWINEAAVEAYGQYRDEYKIKKSVLLAHFPKMCELLGNITIEHDCDQVRNRNIYIFTFAR